MYPKIGIFTPAHVYERNMEHLLYRTGMNLKKCFDVQIVGLERTTDRVRENFTLFNIVNRYRRNTILRKLLLFPLGFLTLVLYIRKERPDVLMTISNIGANGLMVSVCGRAFGIPTITRVTSDIFNVYKHKGEFLKKWKLYLNNNLLGRVTILLSKKVVVLHETLVDELEKNGFSKEKFFVIPQPIEFGEENISNYDMESSRKMICEHFGIPLDHKIVTYIGRIDPDKNIPLLSEVIKYIVTQQDTFSFLIVGDGSLMSYLKESLASYNVHFTGQLPRDTLIPYYQASDYFIMTSPSEGLSTSIAEALYFEVPVVTTDSGSVTRSMVSNIGASSEELGNFILKGSAVVDICPKGMEKENNQLLWLQLLQVVLMKKR
jgi:glycosyltransferase involved in cell wall biosynthesis